MKQLPTAGLAGAAFCLAAILAGAALSIFGTGAAGLARALQVTARFSFLLFWLAYAGGAMKTLFGAGFQTIAWRGRDFGLSFASAQLVHVALIAWLYRTAGELPLSRPVFMCQMIALAWTFLLSLLSIHRVALALGHLRWRMLRVTGMESISFAFLVYFLNHPADGTISVLAFYVPFATMCVLGTILRLAAWASRGATVTKSA
nr:hypothetical protein [uncultured Rhodopila sp.]